MSRGRRGGSGNAQHGDESSRYDCDDLHDANPLVLGTRTGWPGDAPISLCLCKTPASAIPPSGSIAGGNGSRVFVASAGRVVPRSLAGSGQWYRDRTRDSDNEPTKAGRLLTRMSEITASGRLRTITGLPSCARLTPLECLNSQNGRSTLRGVKRAITNGW